MSFTVTIKLVNIYNLFYLLIFYLNIKKKKEIHKNINCYKGIYLLHLIVALVGMILFIICAIVLNLTYIDMNPNS